MRQYVHAQLYKLPFQVARTTWDKHDEQMLRLVLDLSPDLLPCGLSVICRKPCNEVHSIYLLLPTNPILSYFK